MLLAVLVAADVLLDGDADGTTDTTAPVLIVLRFTEEPRALEVDDGLLPLELVTLVPVSCGSNGVV